MTAEEGERIEHEIRYDKNPLFMKRCQITLYSVQGTSIQEISKITLSNEYHIRDLIRTFNDEGLATIRPKQPVKAHIQNSVKKKEHP
jgi:transposase